ncbi:MAG: asparagine synthase (glutamine-hydrolyzing), partial [Alphaproteobacteria bacterium]|nr:asparagine synthase (glutamine-hydrolyzing) [Alphaproteobacteria bacterium]
MCGITGLYSFEPRIDRLALHQTAQNMTDALTHRGPDSGDIWQDPDMPFALGHRRLAIIDLSPSGAQPMESPSGRYMIAFNGEIYNFKTLRTGIEQQHGHKFKGHSDTEVILAGFEYWGFEETLAKINGMFAIALWDRKTRALFLARDRFGKKPLYIGWAGSTLVFGSETKALAAHPEFRRDVNRDALTSYLRFGYVPAPFCIYEQVWQIPAGHMMALDTHLLRGGQDLKPLMSSYWSHKAALEEARKSPIENLENTVDEFEKLLSDCVADRMISDVPLGAFLSGGIDSSSIVALMQKHSDKPVKTYTIGFNEKGFNEAEYAKKIAEHLGTEHHELYLDPKRALEIVPRMATMYDEPFADASALPSFLVSEFARESVTVA